jgi:hypothetical protein
MSQPSSKQKGNNITHTPNIRSIAFLSQRVRDMLDYEFGKKKNEK